MGQGKNLVKNKEKFSRAGEEICGVRGVREATGVGAMEGEENVEGKETGKCEEERRRREERRGGEKKKRRAAVSPCGPKNNNQDKGKFYLNCVNLAKSGIWIRVWLPILMEFVQEHFVFTCLLKPVLSLLYSLHSQHLA